MSALRRRRRDSATSPLERRYRALLVLFPREYRARRGEELVGTLLDAAAETRRMPRPAEVADLLRAVLRVRAGVLRSGAAFPYCREGLAAGAAVLLLLQSAYAALVAARVVVYGHGSIGEAGPAQWGPYGYGPGMRLAAVLLLACWPVAYCLLATGRPRWALCWTAAGCLVAAFWVAGNGLPSRAPLSILVGLGSLAAAPVIALAPLGRRTPSLSRRWLVVLAAVVVAAIPAGLVDLPLGGSTVTDVVLPASFALLLPAAAYAAVKRRAKLGVAVAVVALPVFGAAAGVAAEQAAWLGEPGAGSSAVDHVFGSWNFAMPLGIWAFACLAALLSVVRAPR